MVSFQNTDQLFRKTTRFKIIFSAHALNVFIDSKPKRQTIFAQSALAIIGRNSDGRSVPMYTCGLCLLQAVGHPVYSKSTAAFTHAFFQRMVLVSFAFKYVPISFRYKPIFLG